MSARRRDTVADHVRALDLLVRLYEVHLEHVEQPADAAGWDRFGEARESIIAAWQKLTPLTTLLPDAEAQQALRDRMARLAFYTLGGEMHSTMSAHMDCIWGIS